MLPMTKYLLLGLFVMSTNPAFAIDKAFSPIQEWVTPKSAIMGGISDCENIAPYYAEYLNYMATLSKVVPVTYFTNSKCETYIKSQIDTSNIQFVDYSLNSIWIRDYAPIWLQNENDGSFVMANFPYGANYFGKHKQDDQFSSFLAQTLKVPLVLDFPRKQPPFYFDGGNLLIDEDQHCYTSLKADDFPPEMRKSLLQQINCKDVVFLTPIPEELTGHVDTFLKLLPGKKALLAKYSTSPFKEAMESNKKILSDKGFQVIEVDHIDQTGHTNWSYLNSVIVGDNAFVPQYGFASDKTAVAAFASLGFTVHSIKAEQVMRERGSLHCITNFVY
jgi:agmatine/peptidylarginine deiminase